VEAAEISNYASGVVVGKLGTATLTSDELLKAINENLGSAAKAKEVHL
jgi:bifunctional ADP-heptose synthase (sugar kinase/adenylyltransferase)